MDLASEIQIVELEAGTEIVKSEEFSYDEVGSMISRQTYIDGEEKGYSVYVNNDDSRLQSVIGSNDEPIVGDYAYDHLGQRVLKGEIGYTVFIYDIFGNLISEYYPDGTNVRDWVYLGNHRLAMIMIPETPLWHAFPGCTAPPPHIEPPCGIWGDSIGLNWALIFLAPFLIWAGYRFRKRPVILACILAGSVVIIILMVAREGKTQEDMQEQAYYYHNDHLGTPKVITSQSGGVVWEAIMDPFGEIAQTYTARIDNPFRFPGQYEDDLTGMYYNHHRYYIADLGRYNKVDPLHLKSKSNMYSYAGSNSIKYIDFSALAKYTGTCSYLSGGYLLGVGILNCDVQGSCGDDKIKQVGKLTVIFAGGTVGTYVGVTCFNIAQEDDLYGRGDLLNMGGKAAMIVLSVSPGIGGYIYALFLGGTHSVGDWGTVDPGIEAGVDASGDIFWGGSYPRDIKEKCCD